MNLSCPETPWPAPAKLNLFLHITGRRPDGYHLLQTVFQFLEFADELRFDVRGDGRIRRIGGIQTMAEEDDLAVRAAKLLQQSTRCRLGADIEIHKRLPIGGGLGGGSSNAATTLVALNTLWRCGQTPRELMMLGLQLGADVPVFVHGHAAWAEGVGETLQDLEPPQPWYLIVRPQVEVSTAAVFAAPELTRNCPPITISDFLAGGGGNVCEPVTRRRYPEVARALDWLTVTRGFANARMSGTGGCVFAAFDERGQAEAVCEQVPAVWQGFVAQGLNRSPLSAMADLAQRRTDAEKAQG